VYQEKPTLIRLVLRGGTALNGGVYGCGPAPTSAIDAAPTPLPLPPKSPDRLPPSPAQQPLTTDTTATAGSTNQKLVTFARKLDVGRTTYTPLYGLY